jgi:hypothetical protein
MSASDFEIGNRVRDGDGFRGTVHYVGPVAASKKLTDTWIGVEWDSPTRGKHDGSCVDSQGKIHRYFSCVNGAGSFVKPKNLIAGRSFAEVLKERYVDMDAPLMAPDQKVPDAYVVTSRGVQKSIEFLGEEKIRGRQQISQVDKVTVRDDCVAYIGDHDTRELAGHLTCVDLQDNLLSRWTELFALGKNLPELTQLLLHGNRFEVPTPDALAGCQASDLSKLRVLALNGCGLTSWDQVFTLTLTLTLTFPMTNTESAENAYTSLYVPPACVLPT